MGHNTSSVKDIADRLEARVGKLPVSGRYHRPPRTIHDDYKVSTTVLGSGYSGLVRLATGSASNRSQKFAVKAFQLSAVASDKRGQLESEVEVFLGMDHPQIIRLYDVYEAEDFLYLVMEYMAGGELFDRVVEQKIFTELGAAGTIWQMLLALNYIHSHGIVHRDIKLENFLYDEKGSSHLKLIDFGFSKIWDPNIKMRVSCGTLSYVAPEVLTKCYTSQCDMWSLGVIAFVLLAGYMPFAGSSDKEQMNNIRRGDCVLKPERWNRVSKNGQAFTKALLQVDPNIRLTAQSALEHPWIGQRDPVPAAEVDQSIVDALRQFGSASKFRRCCLGMMAWSLSHKERMDVHRYFISMDQNKQGTITLAELKQILVEQFSVPDDETLRIFDALDTNNDEEIHYSDFLAAMVSNRIALHDDLLRCAFKRFDKDSSGYITVENLREVLGETFEGEQVERLVKEADPKEDGRINFAEFVCYLRGEPLQAHAAATAEIIDNQLRRMPVSAKFLKGLPMLVPLFSWQASLDSLGKPTGSADPEAQKSDARECRGTYQPQCCLLM